jgi:two-component system, NarL family, nitrate/nitrite response regulator NarL
MNRASVALVDEQPLFLAGLSSFFNSTDQFQVVATGTSAADAMEIARHHRPNILIMDLSLRGDAIGSIREICALGTVRVIVCTARNDIDDAVKALNAGAHGYVLKGSSGIEVITAVEAVVRGETFINQGIAIRVISALRQTAVLKAAAKQQGLSLREQQIIQLLSSGQTNKEIGGSLGITEKTVKHYMSIIMQKMQARNRLEVVIAAQRYLPYSESLTKQAS